MNKELKPNQVIAPKQFGNPYFDAMSCPKDILPKTFTYHYRDLNGSIKLIELPTEYCVQQGNFVSRTYTGVKTHLVAKHLSHLDIEFSSIICESDDGIEILNPKY